MAPDDDRGLEHRRWQPVHRAADLGFAGAVTALQTGYQFTGTIPYYVVGTLVVSSIILELGPVLTALILAGRIGARYAAELGTMRVTEQIDALESLGRSPASHLVIPRVLAGLIMIPALTILANVSGIGVRLDLREAGAAGHGRRLHLRRAVLLAPVGRLVLGHQGLLLRRLHHRDLLLHGLQHPAGRGGSGQVHHHAPWSPARC